MPSSAFAIVIMANKTAKSTLNFLILINLIIVCVKNIFKNTYYTLYIDIFNLKNYLSTKEYLLSFLMSAVYLIIKNHYKQF